MQATGAHNAGCVVSKLEEYRGCNQWKGLIPAVKEPRTWDEGFRSFLMKYGTFNQIAYDVWIKGKVGDENKRGLRGTSRFKENLEEFTKKGLKFSYIDKLGNLEQEYDFTDEYQVLDNLVCSPRSFFMAEDNWFGFVALSKDKKEIVIVFRGTSTPLEWVEDFTLTMEQLNGEPREYGLDLICNRSDLMTHAGFQQLYNQQSLQGIESPQDTIHRLVDEHKETLDKVTVVGHSLGGGMSQLCAVDLARSKKLGNVPILAIAWAAPKVGNGYLSKWVKSMHPTLRIMRVTVPADVVPIYPPNWLWAISNGGYKHMGTNISLSNKHMVREGILKTDGFSNNHNLEMYLHNIDPARDVALMNKVGDVIPSDYCLKHNISPTWHSLTWPRSIYYD